MKKRTRLSVLFGMLGMLLSMAQPVWALPTWQCLLVGVAETAVPGLGYGIQQDWDKMAILGGLRWYARAAEEQYKAEDDFMEFDDDLDLERDGQDVEVRIRRSAHMAAMHQLMQFDLLNVTWYDLYDRSCEENPDTYRRFLDPFRFQEFGDQYTFWIPIGIDLTVGRDIGQTFQKQDRVTYQLEEITQDELIGTTLIGSYFHSVAEAMFFNGLVHRAMFDGYSQLFSPRVARWVTIISDGLVFGLFHDGTPMSYLTGMYNGWVYHPQTDRFDLTQLIGIFTWTTMIANYHIFSTASYQESQNSKAQDPKAQDSIARRRVIPIAQIKFQF